MRLGANPLRSQMVDFGQDLWYRTVRSFLAEPISRALGGIQVAGLENFPGTGPALVVANHRTSSDPFLLGAIVTRRIHFVVAAFMGKLPLTKQLVDSTGNIVLPVEKKGRSIALMKSARRLLKKGRLVGVFPEGMDNFMNGSPPGTISRFHSTFARLLVSLQMPELPVIPIAFTGEEERVLVQVPGALMKVLDPHLPVCDDDRLIAPVYRKARIAIGTPMVFPEVRGLAPDDQERAVTHIVEAVRARIVQLAEAPTVKVYEDHLKPSAEALLDETDSM